MQEFFHGGRRDGGGRLHESDSLITKAFDGKRDVEIKATHKTIDIFEVTCTPGGEVSYQLQSGGHSLDW